MPRLICIFIADSPSEAHLVRIRLADYGIVATIQNESLHAGAEAGQDWSAAARVLVPDEDAEFAREVAEDFEQRRVDRAEREASDGWSSDPLEWDEWPRCPRCRRRRLTRCPGCHTSGTRFPLAEFVAPESPDAPIRLVADNRDDPHDTILLVCPTCDEAFHPQFYRRCEQCGHEFAAGLEPEAPSPFDATARRGVAWFVSWCLFAAAIYVAWRLLR